MVEAVATKRASRKASTEPKASKPAPKSGGDQFAVIVTGGKQYKVKGGDKLKIEKLIGDYKEGDKVTFDKVLLTADGSTITVGMPFIKGGEVKAVINKIGKYKTVDVIKYKQKSRYFKRYGHRQPYFAVTIESIK